MTVTHRAGPWKLHNDGNRLWVMVPCTCESEYGDGVCHNEPGDTGMHWDVLTEWKHNLTDRAGGGYDIMVTILRELEVKSGEQ